MQLSPKLSMSRTGQLQERRGSLSSHPTLSNWVTQTQQLGPEQKLNAFVWTQEKNVTGDSCPDFLLGIRVKESEVKEGEMLGEDHSEGGHRPGDTLQEETERKLFGRSSTTLSFVTLGQNL